MDHPDSHEDFNGLTVNSGVAQPPSVNPYLTRRKRRRLPSASEMVEGIIKGDITILSRAVTLVESVAPDHQALAQEVIEKCLPYSGNSRRIGITGVPGAGKSTSIDVFGLHVLKDGGKLAVLAIDPSSERTKGSILGDKTRMERLAVHPRAFVRPSPSAGSLGGVARKTRETIVLCEAAGFNILFVETVGVGQSETAVHSMVDFFQLIQVAGTGDEMTAIAACVLGGISLSGGLGNVVGAAIGAVIMSSVGRLLVFIGLPSTYTNTITGTTLTVIVGIDALAQRRSIEMTRRKRLLSRTADQEGGAKA